MVKDDTVSKEEVDELRKMYKGMDMVCVYLTVKINAYYRLLLLVSCLCDTAFY
jgi:hypothetical protein